jgi:hypothetical protein
MADDVLTGLSSLVRLQLNERQVGWPRGITPPGLPQIRTCATHASGSSNHGFAA